MPLISKPNYNQIFASQAPEQDKPAVFNNYPGGWGVESRPNNGKPTIKGFNYLQQTSDLKDLWILQNGACLPYDESIEYAEGAPVLKDGVIQYKTASGFKSRDAVSIPTYNNAADGVDSVTGVAVGAYFNVRSSDEDTMLVEYQNVGGSAVATGKRYPSAALVQEISNHTALPFKQGKSYALHDRVTLDGGVIVKSIVGGNTNNPNINMSGWQDAASAQAITFETEISHGIRTAFDKFEEFKTLQDYGAIGDGTLKTLQHWIDTGRFSSLAAIQIAYPSATSLSESIDYVCLQDMINKNYGKRIYIKSKHYMINKGLRISQGISIIADQRSTFPYGYAATTAKLNFQNLADGEYALTIVGTDESPKITGVELDGFLLLGKQTVNGITIGESLSKDVTELIIRNTVCFNFKDALTTRYLYGATFDAFRAQSCVNGLLLGSQTNQVLFNRGGVVTISNVAISMSNCEGLQFNSYNISNLSKSNGAPITMYQSQAVFTNSYFEYVTNPILAQVGTRNEASYSSTLILDATFKFGESGSFHDIQVASNNAYVELRGRARFGARVVGVDDSTSHVGSHVHGDNLRMNTNTYVENFGVGKWKTYVQYGGGVISQTLHRGFIRVNNTGAAGTGIRLSEKLVANELYTLSYAIKKTDDAQVVSLRNGNKSAVELVVADTTTSDVAIHHCSFVADDANLRLLFLGNIDIYGYTIQRGNQRTTDLTRFFVPDSSTRFVTEGIAAPTSTGWKAGDVVFSFNNTGQLGWFCTNGTNNTWVTMGIIGATKAEGLTESSTASQIVAALKAAGLAV